jgi:hypothetical protein
MADVTSGARVAHDAMSGLALATVTAVLKHLLENGLAKRGVTAQLGGDATISALPPDRVPSGGDERAQLNIFLYLATPHVALRLTGNGEGRPPLALDLHYLLTAYGAQDYKTEILLGHALQVLHESPVVDRATLRDVLATLTRDSKRRVVPAPVAALAGSELADQVDRITIVPEFLSTEEVSKLWSAMQAKYRPSATYKVTAVPVAADRER